MATSIFPKLWTDRPLGGAQINRGHPLARDLSLLILFQEGTFTRDLVYGEPATIVSVDSGSPGMIQEKKGPQQRFGHTSSWPFIGFQNASRIIPPNNVTISCGMIPINTNTVGSLFGLKGQDNPNRIQAHAPYSDGVLYWDFGDSGGTGRVTASGLFTAGVPAFISLTSGDTPAGKAIYYNGIQKASNGNSPAISVTATEFQVGGWNYSDTNANRQETGCWFFSVHRRVLLPGEALEYAMNPYAILVSQAPMRRYWVQGAAAAAGADGGGPRTFAAFVPGFP